jgi:hypothetical protein
MHLGDPLGVYRLPRESQLAILALRWHGHEQLEAAADSSRDLVELKTRQAVEPVPLENPDPEFGRTLPRPAWLQAVSSEARERADRFRVA